jgi:hypothetical protein
MAVRKLSGSKAGRRLRARLERIRGRGGIEINYQ